MALAVATRVIITFPEITVFNLTGGAGADLTIKHGLGRVPIAAWISAIGDGTETANIVSMNNTDIVVNVSAGGDATLFVVGGAG